MYIMLFITVIVIVTTCTTICTVATTVKPNKHPIINTCRCIFLPFETPTTPARTCIMH